MTERLRVSDAKVKVRRTLVQGFVFDLLLVIVIAIGLWIVPLLTGANSWDDLPEWRLLLFSVVKTIVVAVFAYIMRRWTDPKLRPGSPLLPQDPPGRPAAPPEKV